MNSTNPCPDPAISSRRRKYKFGFILSTSLGNITRYQNFRKFAELDRDIEFTWAPVKHYFSPEEINPFRNAPQFIQRRAIVFYQAALVLRNLRSFDAVMIHLYEVDVLTALSTYLFSSPVRVISSDDGPAVDPATYPFHPVDLAKASWRRAVRLRIDIWRARRADLLIPFSRWAADLLVSGAGVSSERVVPLHVGLDLSVWKCHPRPVSDRQARTKILFVGGEFSRKGGSDLLSAFISRLADSAELHLVTKTAPSDLPPNVHVYADLGANDQRLVELYRQADIFVHPTTSDLSPWVVLEAMASGFPVVTTSVGGIVDLVEEGQTGLFVPVGDAEKLADAIERLVLNPAMRREMGDRGRQLIENNFNAEVNVPIILDLMKKTVDRRGKFQERLRGPSNE